MIVHISVIMKAPLAEIHESSRQERPPWTIAGSYFQLDNTKLGKLCVSAKDHLHLDPERNIEVRKFEGRVIYPPDVPGVTNEKYFEVLSCKTIPEVWLRLGKSAKDIVIMMIYSAFLEDRGYVYEVILISSPPSPRIYPEPKNLLSVPSDRHVYRLRGTVGGLHLCWNVKKYLLRMKYKKLVAIHRYDVQAERFEIQYPSGSKNHVTLKCPSTPVMYLYIGNSEYDIKIVLEEREFPIL